MENKTKEQNWKKLKLVPLEHGFPCPQTFIDRNGKEWLMIFGSSRDDNSSCYLYDIVNDTYQTLMKDYDDYFSKLLGKSYQGNRNYHSFIIDNKTIQYILLMVTFGQI